MQLLANSLINPKISRCENFEMAQKDFIKAIGGEQFDRRISLTCFFDPGPPYRLNDLVSLTTIKGYLSIEKVLKIAQLGLYPLIHYYSS